MGFGGQQLGRKALVLRAEGALNRARERNGHTDRRNHRRQVRRATST
jgi:hypothetical protein